MKNNSMKIGGVVDGDFTFQHQRKNEKFYQGYVVSTRKSGTTDRINIVVSENVIGSELLKDGTSVEITGEFRSMNEYSDEDKKSHLRLYMFAKEVRIGDADIKFNNVKLRGYICKPTQYRLTPFGREVCDLLIAVHREYGRSDYIPCLTWGRNAKFAGNLSVGTEIEVEGRAQSRVYQRMIENNGCEYPVSMTAYELSVSDISVVKEDTEDDESKWY